MCRRARERSHYDPPHQRAHGRKGARLGGARRAPLPADRELRADRGPAHRRAGRPGRQHRLVLPRALRRAQPLRVGARRRHRRQLPHRTRHPVLEQAAVPAGYGDPADPLLQPHGCGRGHRLHARQPRSLRHRAARQRGARIGRVPHGVQAGLRLRALVAPRDGGRPAPRAVHLGGRAQHRAGLEPRPQHRGPRRHRALPPRAGRGRVVRAPALRLRSALGGRHGAGDPGRDARLLAQLALALQLRRALARDGAALGDHAQALHVPAHRRDGRGAHVQPARGLRRRPQLGLPLRLAARLGLHRLRLPAARLLRGGPAVRRLARGALPGDRPGRPRAADRLRHRRRPRPHRAGAAPPRGLPRLEAGADRQRGLRPAAAGRLRRADGRGVPFQQAGADQLGAVEQPAPPARLAGRQLAAAGRGHLGGARRPPALRLLTADVLGGVRARDAHAGPAWPAGQHHQVARRAGRDLRGDHGQGVEP